MIRLGKIRQTKILNTEVTETTEASIVEKTTGNYMEILFRIDSRYLTINGVQNNSESNATFDVYCDKTIPEILSFHSITDPVWIEPLAEV